MIIVHHSSDSFVPTLSVSMCSIMENNKHMDEITFFLIEHGITEENKNRIKDMVERYNRNVVFIPIPNMQKEYQLKIAHVKNRWILDSYIRLFLGTLLPKDIRKVLYLDCDVICDGALDELWAVDLGDNIIAGVADCLSEPYYDFFHLSKNARYCNSGVMLIDLDKWRRNSIENKVREYVNKRQGYVFFMEQSVMNIVLDGRIKVMHPKFNTYTLLPVFGYDNLHRLRRCQRFYTREEIKEAIESPHLIHLTNSFYVKYRAWICGNDHPYRDKYNKYRKLTPWGDVNLQEGNMTIWNTLLHIAMRLTPKSLVAWSVGFVYNKIRPIEMARQQKRFFERQKTS